MTDGHWMPTKSIQSRDEVFEAAMLGLQWTQEWVRDEIRKHNDDCAEITETLTELERVQTLGRAQLRALYAAVAENEDRA